MKEIPLTQGKVALVDDEDYRRVSKYKWYANCSQTTPYAQKKKYLGNGRQTTTRLHRFILNINNKKIQVDHKDGDGLNNQKLNLRLCISSQNNMNRGKIVGVIKYKGVSLYKKKYKDKIYESIMGQIRIQGEYIKKSFKSEIEAAKWYDEMAVKYFGEFAKTNKMLGLLD